MADAPNKFTTLNGMFKDVYGVKLLSNVPYFAKMQSDVGFSEEERVGNNYQQTIETQLEHGITYAQSTDDAFTLGDAVAGATVAATVKGSQHVLKTQIGYKAAYAAEANDKRAFENATKGRVKNMWTSLHRRLEVDLLYGQSDGGIGIVESTTGTPQTFVITAATWAPGIWAGMTGAHVLAFATAGALGGAGPTGARSAANNGVSNVISAVNIATRTITLTNSGGNGITSLAAGDIIYFHGGGSVTDKGQARTGSAQYNTMAGLDVVARIASGGTLFGVTVNGDTFGGSSVSAGSTDLSYATINDAIAIMVSKGTEGDCVCYCSPITWGNLMSDQGALRRYDASQNSSKYTVGAKEIEFYSQSGKITIKSHPCVKQGHAFVIMPEEFSRIGSTDVTFNRANMGGSVSREESYFMEISGVAGFELRGYSDQALFTPSPHHVACITNIVNS